MVPWYWRQFLGVSVFSLHGYPQSGREGVGVEVGGIAGDQAAIPASIYHMSCDEDFLQQLHVCGGFGEIEEERVVVVAVVVATAQTTDSLTQKGQPL